MGFKLHALALGLLYWQADPALFDLSLCSDQCEPHQRAKTSRVVQNLKNSIDRGSEDMGAAGTCTSSPSGALKVAWE